MAKKKVRPARTVQLDDTGEFWRAVIKLEKETGGSVLINGDLLREAKKKWSP